MKLIIKIRLISLLLVALLDINAKDKIKNSQPFLKTSIVVCNLLIQNKINNLEYLKKFNGEYPYTANLFNDKLLSKRLKNLLKDRFLFLKKNWAVETPIEVRNNIFKAWGCKQHFCDSTNFIIVVDFKKNVIYVGIRENENVKVYSEDGSKNKFVEDWSKRIS